MSEVSSLRERLGAKKQSLDQAPPFDELEDLPYGKLGMGAQLMLTFRKLDGYQTAIPYLRLKSIDTHNIESELTIFFDDRVVKIHGSNLEKVFYFLTFQRYARLHEQDRVSAMNQAKDEAVITKLDIKNA